MDPQTVQVTTTTTPAKQAEQKKEYVVLKFPYKSEEPRLRNYTYHKKLFKGHHFEAFNIQVDDPRFSKAYEKLRYLAINFPGLMSRVIADMLFIEPPKIKVKDGDQKFLDALLGENKMRINHWESGLSNSYYGDALFKIRVGKRNYYDTKKTIIIDRVPPRIYFPSFNQSDMLGQPKEQELAWIVMINDQPFLQKEIHIPGKIKNQLFKLKGDQYSGWEIVSDADITLVGLSKDKAEVNTGIDRSLLIHIPNWRDGDDWNGTSDYYDMDSLFFAVNNRVTKIDNILDKHSDPILMVPPGVLDENGRVKKKALGVIEIGEDEDKKPEYIVWDASLENAYKQLEFFIDTTLEIGEISPMFVGRDKGGNIESGRALKYKILRTMAKAQRKQLYYREGLIELYYVAQLIAKEWGVSVEDTELTGKPVKPEIEWSDGLPADMIEQVEIETKRIDAGLTTKKDAIMRLDDVEEDIAEQKVKEIDKESALELPTVNTSQNANQFQKPNNQQPTV